MADSFSFKVFSGPHTGLVFDLSPGSYSIGHGVDNDLIFADEEMVATAGVIEVTPFGVNVNLEAEASLNGDPIPAGPFKWESGTFLQIGDTLLCYRSSAIKGAWAKPAFQTKDEPKAAEGEDGSGALNPSDQSSADSNPETASAADQKGEDAKADTTDAPITLQTVLKDRSSYPVIIGALLLFVLLLGLMFGSTFFSGSSLDEDLQSVNRVIEENNFKLIKVSSDSDVIQLSGSVESHERYAHLMKVLPPLKNSLSISVDVRDDEILGVERDFAALGFCVRAHYIDGGKIGVDGYMSDAYVQAEAFNAMEERYKDRLKGRIIYRPQLENVLKTYCSAMSLKDIKVVMGKGMVFYKGKTTLEDENALEKARYETSKSLDIPLVFTKYDPLRNSSIERLEGANVVEMTSTTEEHETSLASAAVAAVKTATAPARVKKNDIDEESILSVTMKPMRFVTLKNGRKYFEGGVLPSGYVVSKIDLKKIVLTKDNEVKELQLK